MTGEINQSQIEDLLRRRARGRVADVTYCLGKLEAKIAAAPDADDPRVPRWRERCAQYREHLAAVARGSYPGYNGRPFGAVPGLVTGPTTRLDEYPIRGN